MGKTVANRQLIGFFKEQSCYRTSMKTRDTAYLRFRGLRLSTWMLSYELGCSVKNGGWFSTLHLVYHISWWTLNHPADSATRRLHLLCVDKDRTFANIWVKHEPWWRAQLLSAKELQEGEVSAVFVTVIFCWVTTDCRSRRHIRPM